ncbi:hypothetical protein FM125_03170 [Micrococcus lylae]|uniref:Uncharacterized protein n=1 Tax=Micrococcus lylae TaxID=1273 RepID=A0A1R4IKV6_9MICC|nr:hypothetical protein FM125_03170 [Micrococcus lylae]
MGMELLITLLVLAAVVAVGVGLYRHFKPEIERARRIRRANRGGEIER